MSLIYSTVEDELLLQVPVYLYPLLRLPWFLGRSVTTRGLTLFFGLVL